MKIFLKYDNKLDLRFIHIREGETFFYRGEVYLKIPVANYRDSEINTILLSNGTFWFVCADEKVAKVDGQFSGILV